ncbi:thiamine-phosphate kinase [Aurantivibrio plasticivorans]
MAISEFDLINKYFKKDLGGYGVALGIGDDCALLNVPMGKTLATSMDTLVGGNHFPKNADPELIAERAMRVNLSDLAAMGAEPMWYTLGLTMPSADEYWLDGFTRGLFRAGQEFNCALVGGDTTRGPLSLTIQVMGAVELNSALQRSGARVGDRIYVTGTLGDGAAGVAVIKQELQVGKSAFNYFMGHYYRPTPRLKEGVMLRDLASAAVDISDGLMAELGHICTASGVGAEIRWEDVPVSEALNKLATEEQVVKWALTGGDDYELCFTVPENNVRQLEHLIAMNKIDATEVGVITGGRDVLCKNQGRVMSVSQSGFQHFG